MKKQVFIFLVFYIIFNPLVSAQQIRDNLFSKQSILSLKLNYSNKEVKNSKIDSVYFQSMLSYKMEDDQWNSLEVGLRKRGISRLENCYYAPVKMKFKKKEIKNTLFNGNKKLKLVLPCLKESRSNDYVIKEYIAYKMYEIITEYHFKTRLVDIDYQEIKGKKTKPTNLKGFLKEDNKKLVKRLDGKLFEREFVNPYVLDTLSSVRNAFFNYLIGNTDFSQSYLHNVKLVYVEKKIVPICYDFDMCGLVNASYATVPESVNIEHVTERVYRGMARSNSIFYQIRDEYLKNKSEIISCIDAAKNHFKDPKEFSNLRAFVLEFFDVLSNKTTFKQQIIDQARSL